MFAHISCHALPASPQNFPRYQVSEFLTESKTKPADPTTNSVLIVAPIIFSLRLREGSVVFPVDMLLTFVDVMDDIFSLFDIKCQKYASIILSIIKSGNTSSLRKQESTY